MKPLFLFLLTAFWILAAIPANAQTATRAFDTLRTCVMANAPMQCRALLTSSSYTLFDRFVSYGLLPCLPTNFTVESEKRSGTHTIVNASMPASATTKNVIHLDYAPAPGQPLLDIPATLRLGLGERWEKKIQFAEQLYLLMRTNLGDKLTCDKLQPLVK